MTFLAYHRQTGHDPGKSEDLRKQGRSVTPLARAGDQGSGSLTSGGGKGIPQRTELLSWLAELPDRWIDILISSLGGGGGNNCRSSGGWRIVLSWEM